MSVDNVLMLSFVIWLISILNISYTLKKQNTELGELFNIRILLVALFVAFSIVVISIAVSRLL